MRFAEANKDQAFRSLGDDEPLYDIDAQKKRNERH